MTRFVSCISFAVLAVSANSACAGGLWLNEFTDFAGGRAAAGAAAGVDEAMTIAYNPASITRIEGRQVFASAGAVLADMKFDLDYSRPRNGTGNGGNAGEAAITSAAAYVHDFDSSRWSAGIALVPLSGAGMEYDDNWAGRYQATKVDLLLMALAPTVAYQLTDRLSLGVTAQVYYADLNMHFNVPHPNPLRSDSNGSINGDDSNVGFTLGAMYALTEGTRLGVFYQSKLEPEFNGDLKVKPSLPGAQVATDTELSLAEYMRVGLHQQVNQQWSLDATAGWDNWSVLDNVLVSTEDGAAGIPTRWRDTYHYALGAQYKLDKYWTLTGGIAYDTNPVDAEDRNAQLPVDRQVRYALGARYQVKDTFSTGGYLNYADLGRARISGQRFGGEYRDNSALQLVLNANWSF